MSSSEDTRAHFMGLALSRARLSPPRPTNYCVGAVLVDESNSSVLATGYTLELPGNTHAEQCCLQKLAEEHGVPEKELGTVLPAQTAIYTTMEPCVERQSGNLPCVDRILGVMNGMDQVIKRVYCGVKEPDTFVKENSGKAKLEGGGIEYIHVPGFEEEILKVAKAGHDRQGST